jgi:hypothetical protein
VLHGLKYQDRYYLINKTKNKFTMRFITSILFILSSLSAFSQSTGYYLKGAEPETKIYVATLTQTGTDAPVATEVYNTIGAIVWTYVDVGQYAGTLTGAFPAGKLWLVPNTQYGKQFQNAETIELERTSDNVITLYASEGNSVLANTPIQIIVYP